MHKIVELKAKFAQKFPFTAEKSELGMLASSIKKVDLTYYINNENILTGDPNEHFDSRKTKIKDENYKSLYDQLLQEWTCAEQLEPFDDAIIESPKYASRKLRKQRLLFLKEPENIVDDDLDELNEDEDKDMRRDSVLRRQGAQTYKFQDLASLVVDKGSELEIDDYGDSDDDSEYGHEDQLPSNYATGLRLPVNQRGSIDKSLDLARRVSVGSLAPGIKVRKKDELIKEYEQRDIIIDHDRADPLIYSI